MELKELEIFRYNSKCYIEELLRHHLLILMFEDNGEESSVYSLNFINKFLCEIDCILYCNCFGVKNMDVTYDIVTDKIVFYFYTPKFIYCFDFDKVYFNCVRILMGYGLL